MSSTFRSFLTNVCVCVLHCLHMYSVTAVRFTWIMLEVPLNVHHMNEVYVFLEAIHTSDLSDLLSLLHFVCYKVIYDSRSPLIQANCSFACFRV